MDETLVEIAADDIRDIKEVVSAATNALLNLSDKPKRFHSPSLGRTHAAGIYLLCQCGLVELRIAGAATALGTSFDFEATASGDFLTRSGLEEIASAIAQQVEAWSNSAAEVQLELAGKFFVRTTREGHRLRRRMLQSGSFTILVPLTAQPGDDDGADDVFLLSDVLPPSVQINRLRNERLAKGTLSQIAQSWAEMAKLAHQTVRPDAKPAAENDVARKKSVDLHEANSVLLQLATDNPTSVQGLTRVQLADLVAGKTGKNCSVGTIYNTAYWRKARENRGSKGGKVFTGHENGFLEAAASTTQNPSPEAPEPDGIAETIGLIKDMDYLPAKHKKAVLAELEAGTMNAQDALEYVGKHAER